MTSGARYINVPLSVVACDCLNVERSFKNLDDPKSASFTTPQLVMRMFDGLMSHKIHTVNFICMVAIVYLCGCIHSRVKNLFLEESDS